MKRRKFGLLAGTSVLAATAAGREAQAQSAPASALGAGLTPMGSEIAGNADGSIPPWTGGMTTVPAGLAEAGYAAELFPDEQPVVVIDSSNMAQYAASISAGVQAMMTKYGYKIKVYPTHRTTAYRQYVYDNNVKNLSSGKFLASDPVGGRLGFSGAYGGVPFPVPDTSNPLAGGAQIMWNHICNVRPFNYLAAYSSWGVTNGQKSMAFAGSVPTQYPYFDPDGALEGYNGKLYQENLIYTGPANLVGQQLIVWAYTDPYSQPQAAWELLNGQGRVRRAPEVSFDTPSSQADGIAGYDEYYGFNGSMEKYDWKYIGKQEMFIPANNNALFASSSQDQHQAHFINPDLVRWEKRRCWVVKATLHPGERNVLAERLLYIDEDTWSCGVVDEYDGNLNLYKANIAYYWTRPDFPAIMPGMNTIHNLQADDYVSTLGYSDVTASRPGLSFPSTPFPRSRFDASNMAASAQY